MAPIPASGKESGRRCKQAGPCLPVSLLPYPSCLPIWEVEAHVDRDILVFLLQLSFHL